MGEIRKRGGVWWIRFYRDGQRQIAVVLGVDHETVRQDLLTAENSPHAKVNRRHNQENQQEGGEHSPLDVLAGLAVSDAARDTAEREEQREERILPGLTLRQRWRRDTCEHSRLGPRAAFVGKR